MVDGMIVLGRGMADKHPAVPLRIESGIPFLSLSHPRLKSDCVYVDTKKAFCDLTLYLASLGHRTSPSCSMEPCPNIRGIGEAGFRQE